MATGSSFKVQLTLSVWGLAWLLSLLIRYWVHSGPLTPPPGPVLLVLVAGPGVGAAAAVLSQWLAARRNPPFSQNQSLRMK